MQTGTQAQWLGMRVGGVFFVCHHMKASHALHGVMRVRKGQYQAIATLLLDLAMVRENRLPRERQQCPDAKHGESL
jgi:hypothetical protein